MSSESTSTSSEHAGHPASQPASHGLLMEKILSILTAPSDRERSGRSCTVGVRSIIQREILNTWEHQVKLPNIGARHG